ncbi:MAG: hypothetical protein IJS54_03170 [Desulfovibrio sp.]|nr:hypothetical protein [Desulfovibrio sp.]
MNTNLLYVVDDKGAIQYVQIAKDLWEKMEPLVKPLLSAKDASELKQQERPLADFKTLMEYWDFSYPYTPNVECPCCQAKTDDWRNDPKERFLLTNATLGGLLVFHCKTCGTTIRHKYFKDHVCYEHTTPKKR